MGAAGRNNLRRVIGFSFCPRYLGAALRAAGARPVLRLMRIKGQARERAELVRLGAWIERMIVRHKAELVAILTPEEGGETAAAVCGILQAVTARNSLPLVEVSRIEVAQAVGAELVTNSAICSRLAAGHAALAEELRRRGVRSFFGPRSESARYWTMALLGFGAALGGTSYMDQSIPQ